MKKRTIGMVRTGQSSEGPKYPRLATKQSQAGGQAQVLAVSRELFIYIGSISITTSAKPRGFPIPMRGNEMEMFGAAHDHYIVSDPHEG